MTAFHKRKSLHLTACTPPHRVSKRWKRSLCQPSTRLSNDFFSLTKLSRHLELTATNKDILQISISLFYSPLVLNYYQIRFVGKGCITIVDSKRSRNIKRR